MPWKKRIEYKPVLNSPKIETVMRNPKTKEIMDFIGEGKKFEEIFNKFKPDETSLPKGTTALGAKFLEIQRGLFSTLNALERMGVLKKKVDELKESEVETFLQEFLRSEHIRSYSGQRMGSKKLSKELKLTEEGFSDISSKLLAHKNPFAFEFLKDHVDKVNEIIEHHYNELKNLLEKETEISKFEETIPDLLRRGFILKELEAFAKKHRIGLGTAVGIAKRNDPEEIIVKAKELAKKHKIGLGTALGVAKRKDPEGVMEIAKGLAKKYKIGLGTAVGVAKRKDPEGMMEIAKGLAKKYKIGLGTVVRLAQLKDPEGVMERAKELARKRGMSLSTAIARLYPEDE